MVCHYKVLLMWRPPRDEGGRNDTLFRVVCPTCGPQVQFSPDSPTFAQTSGHVTSLTPGTNYTFQVIAENGVSSETKEQPNFAEISVTHHLPEERVFCQDFSCADNNDFSCNAYNDHDDHNDHDDYNDYNNHNDHNDHNDDHHDNIGC